MDKEGYLEFKKIGAIYFIFSLLEHKLKDNEKKEVEEIRLRLINLSKNYFDFVQTNTLHIIGEITDVMMIFISEYDTGILEFNYEKQNKKLSILFESPEQNHDWSYEFGYWRYTSKH